MTHRDPEQLEKADSEQELSALATELTRLRQRGLDRVDLAHDRQRPIATPRLNELLSEAGYASSATRPEALRSFIKAELQDFHAQAPDAAELIRRLFFDAEGRTPGPAGPAGLLRDARVGRHVSQDTFRKLQRQAFLSFAAFLVASVTARSARVRHRLMLTVVAIAALAGCCLPLLIWWRL